MPSRRRLLAALGSVALGTAAGCAAAGTTAGVVTRKWITVAVPRRGGPVDVTLALLGFEPDRRLVHGEYADIAESAVERGTLSVSESFHDRLSTRFSSVRYTANVVPSDGTKPANGVVDREEFNRLSIGGTATVGTYTGDGGYGHLRLHETAARNRDPADITVTEYDFSERFEG